MSQEQLHSSNFDLCRLCLLEPEQDRNVQFTSIFPDGNEEDFTLHRQIEEIVGIKIEKDGIKPKIICENCLMLVTGFAEMKKKVAESAIVMNYLERQKVTPPTNSNKRR